MFCGTAWPAHTGCLGVDEGGVLVGWPADVPSLDVLLFAGLVDGTEELCDYGDDDDIGCKYTNGRWIGDTSELLTPSPTLPLLKGYPDPPASRPGW